MAELNQGRGYLITYGCAAQYIRVELAGRRMHSSRGWLVPGRELLCCLSLALYIISLVLLLLLLFPFPVCCLLNSFSQLRRFYLPWFSSPSTGRGGFGEERVSGCVVLSHQLGLNHDTCPCFYSLCYKKEFRCNRRICIDNWSLEKGNPSKTMR